MADVIIAYLGALEAAGDNEEKARSATLLFESSVNAYVQAGEAPSAVSTQQQGSLLTIPLGRNTTLCIVPSGIGKNPITSVANDGGVVSSIELLNFSGTLRFVTTSDNPEEPLG